MREKPLPPHAQLMSVLNPDRKYVKLKKTMKSQTEARTPSQQSACSALAVISEEAKAAQGFPACTSSAHMVEVTGTALPGASSPCSHWSWKQHSAAGEDQCSLESKGVFRR